MIIVKTANGDKVTLSISGIIDTETSRELNSTLLDLDYEGLDLTLDFADTDYITSAGLRVLLVARKKLSDETMRIINANESICDVFFMTGFDSLIHIEKSTVMGEQYRLGFANLLRKRVKSDRDDTAYIYFDRRYSWGEIDIASQIIADDLSKLGVKKGSHVGICAQNSINWIFCFYAVQKLNGIAVLINPGLRPNEVKTVSEIGDVAFLCYGEIAGVTTFEQYRDIFNADGCCFTMYDISNRINFMARFAEYESVAGKYTESFPADDASVMIFSSGTTGLPKAILSSSYSISITSEPMIREMNVSREDISLAFLPMFHVFGFCVGIISSVLEGFVSVIPENRAPATMIRLIEQYRCTIFDTVPTMMLAITQDKSFSPEKLSSLRLSVLGGASTTESQMKMLMKLMPNIHFGNVYGMSENAAVTLTKYDDSINHLTQTVGKPVQGVELCIRDIETGKELPIGKAGEICIRSDSMVTCYYRLPIEKQPLDDEGWLATGDLGFMDTEGYLHLVGRKKDLIICGGENISPGEIAEAVMMLPQVEDVKVLGIPHEIKGEVITAAIILKNKMEWNEAEARTILSSRLAKYKIPTHFVIMDSFPLLGSGKVDAIMLKKLVIDSIQGK